MLINNQFKLIKMKKLLLLVCILAFYSCEKCWKCTRKVTVESCQATPIGHKFNCSTVQNPDEHFNTCEIDYVEKQKSETTYVGNVNQTHYETVTITTCDCVIDK